MHCCSRQAHRICVEVTRGQLKLVLDSVLDEERDQDRICMRSEIIIIAICIKRITLVTLSISLSLVGL